MNPPSALLVIARIDHGLNDSVPILVPPALHILERLFGLRQWVFLSISLAPLDPGGDCDSPA